MTGFGSLYYTDCLPGQGLQGGAGFQFQAVTPGTAGEAMHLVARAALYEPPAAWMRDRRPAAAYPRSLAHVAEDSVLATAAGRYLGQEANGTREGNQFTHAVVTRDPADYGAVRPAQLWGADWWAAAPHARTALPEMPSNPAPGPLDIETVRDRVRAAADGEARLVALLSAVQDLAEPTRRRTVVLVSADPEQAACWLAAATLLLPRPEALRVTFKIFVADPQYSSHDVIALHPEWAGRWADTRDDSGSTVFDLDRGRCSRVETTSSAAFWVPRFLRDDPYDIVDAVELAAQFAAARRERPSSTWPGALPDGARAPEPTVADRLVALVVAGGEPLRDLADVDEVARWLVGAPDEAVRIARDPALEAVLATVPPAEVLRTLAAAVGNGRWEDAAVDQVLDGLLASELVEATETEGATALEAARRHEPLRRPTRAGESRWAARAAVESALRDAPPDRFPALLTLAARHGVHPETNGFADAADRFARWWLESSDVTLMPERWDAPPEALDWVRDVLRRILASTETADSAVLIVQDRWWRPLLEAASDPADALDRLVWSSAYAKLHGEQARRLRRRVLDACLRVSPGAPGGTRAWSILFRFTPKSPWAYCVVVDALEKLVPMSPEVAAEVIKAVDEERELSVEGLWLADALDRHGYRLSPELVEQRDRDRGVLAVVAALRAPTSAHPEGEIATALDAIPPAVRRVRMPKLLDALIGADRELAAGVLRAVRPSTLLEVGAAMQRRWERPASADRSAVAALAFVATAEPRGPQQQDFTVLRNLLDQHVKTLDKEERAAIFRALPPGRRGAWTAWRRSVEPNLIRRSLGQVTSSFRGEQGKREG